MAGETEDHRGLVADLVDHEAEKHDADGEGPQAHAEELAFLRFGEVELRRPGIHEECAQQKPE